MENTPPSSDIKKESNLPILITAVIIGLIIIGFLTNGFGLLNKKNIDYNVSIGNSPVLGDKNAPITLYEFSDFSCPYCAAADGKNAEYIAALKQGDPNWEPPIPEIIKNYVDTGKVKLVFKYKATHGTGKVAHIVSLCMQEQGMFWEFLDGAFANQLFVSSPAKMKDLAIQIGANQTKLEYCLGHNTYSEQLNAEDAESTRIGIQGTPSFIIGNNLIEGPKSYSTFKQIIDSELAKK